MTGFVMFLHAVVAILLIVIILMQSGRGGGLTEGFGGAESLFGAKTNEFMIKVTTIFALVFLVTCLGLAVLSAQKNKSLMSEGTVPLAPMTAPNVPATQTVEDVAGEANDQVNVIEEKAASNLPIEVPVEDTP